MKYVTLLALLFATSISAMAQPSPLTLVDHFRCYPFPQQQAQAKRVGMSDQFTPNTFRITLSITPAKFCDPVQKTVNGAVTPILDPNHHFVMYAVTVPTPGYDATISNQFGTQDLALSGPTILAVPAGLTPLSPSADLDHYECYAAQLLNQQFNSPLVTLQDAFITEDVTVILPVLFCNPMIKSFNGLTTIQHPDTHLTCYSTSPAHAQSGNVNTTDQFFTKAYPIETPDWLCVPSLKLKWNVHIAT